MQCQVTIDDTLIREARQLTGISSDRDLMELGLRALIDKRKRDALPGSIPAQKPDRRDQNPIAALLESDFVGCALTDETDLSRDYKAELTAILEKKHGHR